MRRVSDMANWLLLESILSGGLFFQRTRVSTGKNTDFKQN